MNTVLLNSKINSQYKTLYAASKDLGIAYTSLKNYMEGKSNPNRKSIKALCKGLSVSIEDLMYQDSQSTPILEYKDKEVIKEKDEKPTKTNSNPEEKKHELIEPASSDTLLDDIGTLNHDPKLKPIKVSETSKFVKYSLFLREIERFCIFKDKTKKARFSYPNIVAMNNCDYIIKTGLIVPEEKQEEFMGYILGNPELIKEHCIHFDSSPMFSDENELIVSCFCRSVTKHNLRLHENIADIIVLK
jgi:transcriptional regulator with XRE-family HTH domain